MPVIINKETGLAENIPDNSFQPETHEIPMVDPQGNDVIVPYGEAASALQQGYTQPNPEQLKKLMNYTKFSSTEQQVKTGLEGAADAMTFGTSTGAEVGLGIATPEDIQNRKDINPGDRMGGQMVGLGLGMATGVGEGAILEAMGAGAAKAIAPVMGTSFAGRVGTQAAKAAIENMAFQGSDEVSKAFSKDPAQHADTIISNVGLSGILGGTLGGGFGATSELWKLGPGKKIGTLLNAISDRTAAVPAELKAASGMNLPKDVDVILSDSPYVKETLANIAKSDSHTGQKLRNSIQFIQQEADNSLVNVLGKTPEQASNMSEHMAGKEIQDSLIKKLDEQYKPISEQYEKLDKQFENAPLFEIDKAELAQAIVNKSNELGWGKISNNPAQGIADNLLRDLPKQQTVLDLRNYTKNFKAPYDSPEFQAVKELKKLINNSRDTALTRTIGEQAPELLQTFKTTQNQYHQLMNGIEDLNSRLKVGKFDGPETFMEALRNNLDPETVLKRLSPKGKADIESMLGNAFPDVLEMVRGNELNKVLKGVKGTETEINAKELFKRIDGLSPEMRELLFNPEQTNRLSAIKELLERSSKKTNTFVPGRTIDKIWSGIPASAAGIGYLIMGASAPASLLVGGLTHLIGKEGPDAVRMAMLKFLTSGEKVSAEGFRSAVQTAGAVLKGESALNKNVISIFRSGKSVISEPSAKERDMLKAQVTKVAANPEQLLKMGGDIGHYMPEHASMLAMATVRNMQYLATLRPNIDPQAPLDAPVKVSKTEEAIYNRALDIAENPNIVLKDVKHGTLTKSDMVHLQTMYPALYTNMSEKIMEELVNAKSEQLTIPYKTRMGLSIFLQQPLDSSMRPVSIFTNQAAFLTIEQENEPATKLEQLKQSPKSATTTQQSREMHRNTSRQG